MADNYVIQKPHKSELNVNTFDRESVTLYVLTAHVNPSSQLDYIVTIQNRTNKQISHAEHNQYPYTRLNSSSHRIHVANTQQLVKHKVIAFCQSWAYQNLTAKLKNK